MSDRHLTAAGSLDHGKANGHVPDQVFRDPASKEECWRVVCNGRVLPTDWTGRGAAETFLTNLPEDGMTTKSKKYTSPGKKATRRGKGEGKLSCHARKDAAGNRIPDRYDGKAALFKFTLRTAHGCRTFYARDWADAERLSALAAVELQQVAAEAKATAVKASNVASKRTVNELADHFLAIKSHSNSRTSEGSVSGYRRELERFVRPHFGTMPVVAVTPEDVDRWVAKYASEGKSRTRQKRVNLLGSLFLLAVGDGWRSGSPVLQRHRVPVLKVGKTLGKLVGDQREANPLNMAELVAVVDKLDADDPALRLLVELTGRMGFRLREATHLRFEDVKICEDGSAFIRVVSGRDCLCRDCRGNGGKRRTKNSSERLAPIPPDYQDAVSKHLEALRARFGPRGWLFPCWRRKARQRTKPGDLRVAHVVSGAFTAAAEAVGLTDRIFHDLRATAKQHLLLDLGSNPTAVDIALGHALPGMSQIYVTAKNQPAQLYQACYPTWKPRLTVVKEAKTA